MDALFGGTLILFLAIAGLILAVLWIIMPFVVFRMNDKAAGIFSELREANRLLRVQNDMIERQLKREEQRQ